MAVWFPFGCLYVLYTGFLLAVCIYPDFLLAVGMCPGCLYTVYSGFLLAVCRMDISWFPTCIGCLHISWLPYGWLPGCILVSFFLSGCILVSYWLSGSIPWFAIGCLNVSWLPYGCLDVSWFPISCLEVSWLPLGCLNVSWFPFCFLDVSWSSISCLDVCIMVSHWLSVFSVYPGSPGHCLQTILVPTRGLCSLPLRKVTRHFDYGRKNFDFNPVLHCHLRMIYFDQISPTSILRITTASAQ